MEKICGPGNRFVTAAKQIVKARIARIDMPAGPTEAVVLADTNGNPRWIAADSAGATGWSMRRMRGSYLVTSSTAFAQKVREEVMTQLKRIAENESRPKFHSENGGNPRCAFAGAWMRICEPVCAGAF